MIQRRDRAGFAIEPFEQVGVGGELFGENLDCDRAIEPRVAGPVHFAHATGPDRRHNLVRSESSTRRERHGEATLYGGEK